MTGSAPTFSGAWLAEKRFTGKRRSDHRLSAGPDYSETPAQYHAFFCCEYSA
jgi:hypothetical protein